MSDYPKFVPPENLATKTPREWSKTEADEYASWLGSEAGARTANLLRFFGVAPELAPTVLLEVLGKRVAEALRTEAFSQGEQLTIAGYALAADMGLLVAELLLRECGDRIHWQVVRRPKSDLDYNQPVLAGFGPMTLNPVRGSIAESVGVLRDWRGWDAWLKIFGFWRSRAQ
ncbi:MAG: hypothetical protein IPJ17_12135 [Holophagales bacterium]|nr:MAG: hypothetical protein IPJ17_12135 [Holophagales bacterium]